MGIGADLNLHIGKLNIGGGVSYGGKRRKYRRKVIPKRSSFRMSTPRPRPFGNGGGGGSGWASIHGGNMIDDDSGNFFCPDREQANNYSYGPATQPAGNAHDPEVEQNALEDEVANAEQERQQDEEEDILEEENELLDDEEVEDDLEDEFDDETDDLDDDSDLDDADDSSNDDMDGDADSDDGSDADDGDDGGDDGDGGDAD